MKNRLVYIIFSTLFLFLIISSVSAEILISQPSSRYNLGDNFDVKIEVKRVVETNDFLKINIVCDSNSVELYRAPLRVQVGKTENISIKAKLDRSLIESTEGSCKVNAEYADESAQSSSFEISDKIDLSVKLSSTTFNPGDMVYISGSAKKQNGEKLNGFLQISLSGTNVSFLANQVNENFNYSFYIPKDQPANIYGLAVKVYERESSGEIANEGIYSETIRINQVVTTVDVSLNSAFIIPGENLSYTVILKDQSGQEVKTDVNSIIYTSYGKDDVFLRKNVKSGEINVVEIPYNATPGSWSIEGFYNSKISERSFSVEPVSKASFYVEGNELVIVNEGNVPYQKTIAVFIDDEKLNKTTYVSLENPVKRYKIDAPMGIHQISVMDDSGKDFDLGEVNINTSSNRFFGITAAAIGLSDSDSNTGSYIKIIFWVVLIIVLLYVAIYYYRKVRKDIFYGKKPQKLSDTQLASRTSTRRFISEDGEDTVTVKPASREYKAPIGQESRGDSAATQRPKLLFDTYNATSENSDSSKDYEAKREEVVVLAVKVKNGQKLRQSESSALNAVRNALHRAKTSKAKVYDQGDTSLVVFSQSLSEKANAIEAVRVAHEIDLAIKDFNKKYAIKVEYGLGMHVGEMFFEIIDGKAKFTSIGNITILPKNLASKANCSLLLSQELYRKVYTVVKAEQEESGVYKIVSFKDRSSQSQFIQRFMKKPTGETAEAQNKPLSKIRIHHPALNHESKAHSAREKNVHSAKSLDSGIHPPKKRTFQRY